MSRVPSPKVETPIEWGFDSPSRAPDFKTSELPGAVEARALVKAARYRKPGRFRRGPVVKSPSPRSEGLQGLWEVSGQVPWWGADAAHLFNRASPTELRLRAAVENHDGGLEVRCVPHLPNTKTTGRDP